MPIWTEYDYQRFSDQGELFVVCTIIDQNGDTDSLVIEPFDHIDEGCVAITKPMTFDDAKFMFSRLYSERLLETAKASNILLEEYAAILG